MSVVLECGDVTAFRSKKRKSDDQSPHSTRGRDSESNKMAYSEVFKDHIAHPRNAGELADADAVAEEINPVCGDRLRLSLRVRDGRIEAVRFLAYGCAPTLACGSALTEIIQQMPLDDAAKLSRKQIVDALGGLSPQKQHAAALAIETLQGAIATFQRQNE